MTEYYRLYHIAKLYYTDGYKQREPCGVPAF